MIKAIVFDFDGVILESAGIKTDAFGEVVSDYPEDLAASFVDYHRTHMGISRHVKFRYFIEEILKQPYSEQLEAKLANKFEQIVYSKVLKCDFVPGAESFLSRNYQKYDCYIASGTPKEELLKIINERKLSLYFKEIFGTPQTKEEIVETIVQKYSYQKSEMVFVGDARTDQIAANRTKLTFIGRNTKDNVEVFKDEQYRVDNLLEMEEILKTI